MTAALSELLPGFDQNREEYFLTTAEQLPRAVIFIKGCFFNTLVKVLLKDFLMC